MSAATPSAAAVRDGYAVLAVVRALVAALVLRSFDLEGFFFVIAVAVALWVGGRGPVLALAAGDAAARGGVIETVDAASRALPRR